MNIAQGFKRKKKVQMSAHTHIYMCMYLRKTLEFLDQSFKLPECCNSIVLINLQNILKFPSFKILRFIA